MVLEPKPPKDDPFFGAELVHRNEELDLAVLKPKDDPGRSFDFAKFGSEEDIQTGMELLFIAHPRHLCYSLLIKEVTFPCEEGDINCNIQPIYTTLTCRIVGGIRRNRIDTDFREYGESLEVIQINNFHGSRGASSALVFDSRGRVVGIYSFILENYDFAIHLRVSFEFRTYSLSRLPSPEKEKLRGNEAEKRR